MADVTIRPLSPTAIPHLIASHIVKTAKKTAPEKVDLAAAVIDVEHRTQIAGAGMVTVTLMDPDWVILESPFIEVNDDGLLDEIEINFPEGSDSWWRLAMVEASTDLTQPNVMLTFEDRIAAYLRDKWGPKKVAPGTTTRAQFVKQLVDEVGRHDGHQRIRFVCPELNVVQPVAVASVAAGASTGAASLPSSIDPVTGKPVGGAAAPASSVTTGSGANASKGRGIGAGAAVTAKGQPLDAGQIREANTLLAQANTLKAGPIATEAIICAGIGESWLGRAPGSFAPNSAGYWGVLQGGSGQKGSAANFPDPHDTAGQASSFLLGGKGFQAGGAIALARGGVSDPGQIAALVEGSGAGSDFYGRYLDEAKKIIAAGGGITTGAQGSTGAGGASDVGQLQRGTTDNPDENSWDCIQQLAGDVGWYAFSNADTLYYMDGPDLVGQKPALYLDRVKNVDQIQSFNATFDNALALDTPIPTPDGWTTMGDLEAGDVVLGSDGRPTDVVGVSPVQHDHECYRVHFNDGTSIVADAGHLWETRRYETAGDRAHRGTVGLRTTGEILDAVRGTDGGYAHRVKVAEPLDLPERELPIDPYVLGYWLGDGRAAAPMISVDHSDVPSLVGALSRAGYGYAVREYAASPTGFSTRPQVLVSFYLGETRARGAADNMTQRLRDLGVLNNKHVPAKYLRASALQRLALLQGLMDSDGSVGRACCLQLSDGPLAAGALEIARSLGFRANFAERPAVGVGVKPRRLITFATRGHLNPFRLPRKADRYDARLAEKTNRGSAAWRSIVAVEPVDSVPVRCIAVDMPDHLYLAGEAMVPTHNSAFLYQSTKKVKGKVQRRSRVAKPQTPAQVRLRLVCQPFAYRAGDCFVLKRFGPANGRWIVSDATRRCLSDTFTQFTLIPPREAYPEPLATADAAGSATTAQTGPVSSVADAALKALSEKAKYVYREVRPIPASLFGPAPRIMDCSGFATLCYKAAGAPDPNGDTFNYNGAGNTASLIANCTKVTQATAQPGDLCFFGSSPAATTHVNVYVGNGQSVSMGSSNDPSQGPAAQMGPSGFLGYWRPKAPLGGDFAPGKALGGGTFTPSGH